MDAQLAPSLAAWINEQFRGEVEASSLKRLGLLKADDETIWKRAREDGAVILTKDGDFARLVRERGMPPQVIWYRGGNASKEKVKQVLQEHLPELIKRLRAGKAVVEIEA